MTDSIKINNDIKKVTRYAMGLNPDEPKYSIDPATTVWTIGLEKGIRGAVEIAPELKDLKKLKESQNAINPRVKGKPTLDDINRFNRAMEVQGLERRFRKVPAPQAPTTNDPKAIKEYQKALKEFQKSSRYDNVRSLINEAKTLKGKDYANKIKEIHKAIADADLKVHNDLKSGAINTVTKRGKAWYGVQKYTGWNSASGGVKKALTKSSTLRSIAKFGRANALTAVSIDTAFAIPEIMQTKAQLGTEAAVRQTGRTLAVAGAQVGGYAAGAWAGGKAGAAIGTMIGGPIGTAVGGIIGVGVGLLGSWLAGIGAQKIVGKSELDQHASKLAENAAKDDGTLQQVTAKAAERYNQELELNGGQDTEETDVIAKSYNNVVQAYKKGKIGSNANQETSIVETPIQEKRTAKTKTKQTTKAENKKVKKDPKINNKFEETINKLTAYINTLSNSYPTQSTPFNPYMMNMNYNQNFMFNA